MDGLGGVIEPAVVAKLEGIPDRFRTNLTILLVRPLTERLFRLTDATLSH